MEIKKSLHADLERGRYLRLTIGLLVASSVLLAALQWRTAVPDINLDSLSNNALTEFDIPIIQLEQALNVIPTTPEATPEIASDQLSIADETTENWENNLREAISSESLHDLPEALEELSQPLTTAQDQSEANDRLPTFPGGDAACMRFLSRNIRYPSAAVSQKITGCVVVQFIVEPDGKLTDIRVRSGVNPQLDNEALRVVRLMPDWEPGLQSGNPSRFLYVLPIEFRLR